MYARRCALKLLSWDNARAVFGLLFPLALVAIAIALFSLKVLWRPRVLSDSWALVHAHTA